MRALGCDFYAFSGHKIVRPDRDRRALRQARAAGRAAAVPRRRRDDPRGAASRRRRTTTPPHRFEAGTPDIAGVIGLGAAIDWLERVGLDAHRAARAPNSRPTRRRGSGRLRGCSWSERRGSKGPIVSFTVDGVHPHDVAHVARRRGDRRARRPPLRAAGDANAWASRPPCAPRSRATTRGATSMRWSTRLQETIEVLG